MRIMQFFMGVAPWERSKYFYILDKCLSYKSKVHPKSLLKHNISSIRHGEVQKRELLISLLYEFLLKVEEVTPINSNIRILLTCI